MIYLKTSKNSKGKYKPLTEFLKKPEPTQASRPDSAGDRETGLSSIEEIVRAFTEEKIAKKAEASKEVVAEQKTSIAVDVLSKIASSPSFKRIECDVNGVCKDGVRVGDNVVDEYGIERKRGFVNTTRLPIFLDWVLETANVDRLTDKTFIVKTNRGALAVVPDHFLCELQYRYGITILGLDEKCRDYKPSIGRQYKPKSRRKK
ncbi:hypothetical protein TCELL_0667 [Thermogladius calderae 1633]|uniref:Uncharacterized protein n=1 Tax=Thermogladius calderae (strain DSM 22663 / VKM B-2946 / 1633) TaxID=1184251 RepID=I3TEA3_THEC1|nr:hypothetical protein [Thermogladius calderae]AFK51091.1 hypothetical protein TCELL_0667 [Thermogladius calderae 1633]